MCRGWACPCHRELRGRRVRTRVRRLTGCCRGDGVIREHAGELDDEWFDAQAERCHVRTEERSSIDPLRPPREIVSFERVQKCDWNLGRRGDLYEREAAALAFGFQPGAE